MKVVLDRIPTLIALLRPAIAQDTIPGSQLFMQVRVGNGTATATARLTMAGGKPWA